MSVEDVGAPPAEIKDYSAIAAAAFEGIDDAPGDDEMIARTEVDGREAIIDGTTGAVQEPLIGEYEATDDASVLQSLAIAREEEALAHEERNRAHNAYRAAQKRTEQALDFAVRHYSRSRNLEMHLEVARQDGGDE